MDHNRYASPFSWRYGSPRMRSLWSEAEKRRIWRRIWVAMADAQRAAGLTTAAQVEELRARQDDIDMERAEAIEAEIQHDLMGEVKTYGEQCPGAAGIIHLGATSMDIEDNADALRLRRGIDFVLESIDQVLDVLANQIETYADTPTMAFTHLQPAEPTTMGYRLAWHAQDLMTDRADLVRVRETLRGKGFKGAVGTAASYQQLFAGTDVTPEGFEATVMGQLGLPAFDVASQTYPRKQDWRVLSALSGLGQTLYKFAFDVRILQSPSFGEWAEPFGKKQIGSSAMPFKRNPIHAENMDSLARLLGSLPSVAWDNAAHSLLERTLDDSGNRRVILPQAFLAADELLKRGLRILKGLRVDLGAAARTMAQYGPFAASERMLMEAATKGADRQKMHEVIRDHAMVAWPKVQAGEANPLRESLANDPYVNEWLTADEARAAMQADDYTGIAASRARKVAGAIRERLRIEEAAC